MEGTMDTKQAIASMLVEDTGAALMDSGGTYGRRWQLTRARYGLDGGLPNDSFDGYPRATVAPDEDDIARVARLMDDEPMATFDRYGVDVDTFHWLEHRLAYDEKADEAWQAFDREQIELDLWQSANQWLKVFLPVHGQMTGLYGDGSPDWTNTYNSENLLDRTLQFCLFTLTDTDEDESSTIGWIPDGTYVLLQVHGGADVRGGYTKPRLFLVDADDDADMFSFSDACIGCEGVDPSAAIPEGQLTTDGTPVSHEKVTHEWTTGDGYDWDANGWSTGRLHLDDIEWDEDAGVRRCPECSTPMHAWAW
jgi:hypothetical protein